MEEDWLSFWKTNAVEELRSAMYLKARIYGTLSGVKSCISFVSSMGSLWQLTYRLADWQCIVFARASHMERQNPTTKDAYGNKFCFYKGCVWSILIEINKARVSILPAWKRWMKIDRVLHRSLIASKPHLAAQLAFKRVHSLQTKRTSLRVSVITCGNYTKLKGWAVMKGMLSQFYDNDLTSLWSILFHTVRWYIHIYTSIYASIYSILVHISSIFIFVDKLKARILNITICQKDMRIYFRYQIGIYVSQTHKNVFAMCSVQLILLRQY